MKTVAQAAAIQEIALVIQAQFHMLKTYVAKKRVPAAERIFIG